MMLFNYSNVIKKSLPIAFLLANFLLVSCADDQARTQIADTDARVSQLEQSVGVLGNKVSNQKMLDILNKLDELQSQIDQINGILANVQHNQQIYQDTQNQLNQSMEQQLQSVGATPIDNGASSSAPVGVVKAKPLSDDQTKLNSTLKQIKAHKFSDAIKQLRNLIGTSKDADIVANASYYLTVAYAANGEYKNAMWVGRKFVDTNPKNPNAPDALFTIYVSQQQLGMKKSAINTANQLKKNYPNSSAAKKVQ